MDSVGGARRTAGKRGSGNARRGIRKGTRRGIRRCSAALGARQFFLCVFYYRLGCSSPNCTVVLPAMAFSNGFESEGVMSTLPLSPIKRRLGDCQLAGMRGNVDVCAMSHSVCRKHLHRQRRRQRPRSPRTSDFQTRLLDYERSAPVGEARAL